MSLLATILYESAYTLLYLGVLFSKNTLLHYFPNASVITRAFFLIALVSGFFVPYYLKTLRIRLTVTHYTTVALFFCLLYILASWYYYSTEIKGKNFHSFLQLIPNKQEVKVPKPVDVFRILCLGGSTTRGQQLKDYPGSLQKMLSKKYPKRRIEVINAGKYFYNTQHSLIQYLFYLKDLDPDLIILFHGVNDLITSFTMPPFSSSPFRKDYGHFYGPLAYLRYPRAFEEFLLKFFYADLRKPKLKPASFSDFKSQHSFRRNLETIIKITKSEGIALILSNQAHLYSDKNDSDPNFLAFQRHYLTDDGYYADEKSWYQGMELFNEITRETTAEFSIPFVDQAAAFKGKRELFRESIHMTSEGTELKARLFFKKIVQLKLLEETND